MFVLSNVSTWVIDESGCLLLRFQDVLHVRGLEDVFDVPRRFSLQHDVHEYVEHVVSDAETANETKRPSVVSVTEFSQLVGTSNRKGIVSSHS